LKLRLHRDDINRVKKVFIVPIRDWNWYLFNKLLVICVSFYRPYKGLKPGGFPEASKILLECFYRPYKGLKQIVVFGKNATNNRFYRPYKGLKPFWKTYSSISKEKVFIVPIRDWNFVFVVKYFVSLSCFYRPYKGLKQKLRNVNFSEKP